MQYRVIFLAYHWKVADIILTYMQKGIMDSKQTPAVGAAVVEADGTTQLRLQDAILPANNIPDKISHLLLRYL